MQEEPEGQQANPGDKQSAPNSGLNRRQLLAGAVGSTLAASEALAGDGGPVDLFLPEEQWRERMIAPDDGMRFGWVIDTRRCFGCHGCEVACKAENDVPLGQYIRQTIYHDHTRENGAVARIMIPMSCQHCEDAPCIKACPCGAMHKGAGGSVQVNYDLCSGHAACKEACPYGAIFIDPVANQAIKCHNCTHRVAEDMEPACVETCPSHAIHFGDLNDPKSEVSVMKARLESEGSLEVLRPERETNPRTVFAVDKNHPMGAWEPKIPSEGESYHNDAYSVYSWGEAGFDGFDGSDKKEN